MRNKVLALTIALFTFSTFVEAALVNIALNDGVTAVAQYQEETNPAQYVIDNNVTTLWGAGTSATSWLVVDLGNPFAIDSIGVIGVNTGKYFYENYTVYFSLYTSLDNQDWSLVGSGVLYDNPDWTMRSEYFSLSDQQARFVKFQSTGGDHWPAFNELEVWANVPEPASFAMFGMAILLAARKKLTKS